MEYPHRMPGLDAWRGLGVFFLFNLLFFGNFSSEMQAWAAGAGLLEKIAGRVADLLFSSGVLGFDMLFMVSGVLIFRKASCGDTRPLSLATGLYARLLPFLAVAGIPLLAYRAVSPADYFRSLLLLEPMNVPSPFLRAFAQANAFLLFYALAALWLLLARRARISPAWGWAAGAAVMAAFAVQDSPWLPVNGHFLSFFWGVGVAWLASRLKGSRRLPGWAGAALLIAAALWCRKLSAARGDDLYFLMDGHDWASLASALQVQAILAAALACSLATGGFWQAAAPFRALGRASNSFFMVMLLWSFTLTRAYSDLFASQIASAAFLYAATLGMTLALAFLLAPFLEIAPLLRKPAVR